MVSTVLVIFALINIADGLCFKTSCRSDKGELGCKHIVRIRKNVDMEECCAMDKAIAFANSTLAISGRCYFCSPCLNKVRDGGWSDWTPWNTCSSRCGGGHKIRTRECNNPKPSHFGRQCEGESQERIICGSQPCPENGGWSSWSNWSYCSETCGKGKSERQRTCSQPAPQNGGEDCPGANSDIKECEEIADCPVYGSWNSWGDWSCSAVAASRVRECTISMACSGNPVEIVYKVDNPKRYCVACPKRCNKHGLKSPELGSGSREFGSGSFKFGSGLSRLGPENSGSDLGYPMEDIESGSSGSGSTDRFRWENPDFVHDGFKD